MGAGYVHAASPEQPVRRLRLDGAELWARGGAQTVHATASQVEVEGSVLEGGDVEAAFDGSRSLSIEAQQVTWDLKAGVGVFAGEVRVLRGETSLSCDQLRLSFHDPGHMDRAVAEGHVVVTQAGRRAEARQAVLEIDSGTITLTGSPTVTQGASSLRGERVIFHLDEQHVECQRCTLVVDAAAVKPLQRLGQGP